LYTIYELGFKTNYENDSKFAYVVNKIGSLAILQAMDVYQGFDALYSSLSPMIQPLLDYFEDSYIGSR
jgi:hypothetical protein